MSRLLDSALAVWWSQVLLNMESTWILFLAVCHVVAGAGEAVRRRVVWCWLNWPSRRAEWITADA